MKQHGKENGWQSTIWEGMNGAEVLQARRCWYSGSRREMQYREVVDLEARALLLYRQMTVALSLAWRDGVVGSDEGVPDDSNRL